MLGAIVNVEHLVETAGYPLLFLVVMAESGGVPVPGETGLITAGILSSSGKLQIEFVIAIAAAAAIIGDNIGYLIGRKGGRWVLERPGAFERQRREVLLIGEPFFDKHGPKAVFFGRFILGLRVWASWLAGATRMHWRSFALWNALGGHLLGDRDRADRLLPRSLGGQRDQSLRPLRPRRGCAGARRVLRPAPARAPPARARRAARRRRADGAGAQSDEPASPEG